MNDDPRSRWRRRGLALTVAAMDRAVHAFTRVRYAMPDARPARFDVDVQKDVQYGSTTHACHRLDVYRPRSATGSLPVVMYVHGGGFTILSKETHYVMAMAFARRGYLVFNINYRLGRRNRFPAPLEDACEALVWVHRHARKLGGDPSRIALAGESAGGNLVAALAICASNRRPEHYARRLFDAAVPVRATVCTYPILDMTSGATYRDHPRLSALVKDMLLDTMRSYVGPQVPGQEPPPLASPILLLERAFQQERPLSPFFLSVGTRDPLLDDSRRLKAALDRLGVPCELLVAQGQIHGYDAMVWRPEARAKWKAALRFLARHMQIQEPAAAPSSSPAQASC